jgi:hypothetical protein
MNQYQFTLGSGKRSAQGQNIEEAFKSLGYNNFKVISEGFKKWRIEVEGNPGHKTIYFAKQF